MKEKKSKNHSHETFQLQSHQGTLRALLSWCTAASGPMTVFTEQRTQPCMRARSSVKTQQNILESQFAPCTVHQKTCGVLTKKKVWK